MTTLNLFENGPIPNTNYSVCLLEISVQSSRMVELNFEEDVMLTLANFMQSNSRKQTAFRLGFTSAQNSKTAQRDKTLCRGDFRYNF